MAINKVVYGGKTLIDLTGDSVTPETLAEGTTAHAANGEFVTGTGSLGAVRYDTEQVLTDEQKTQARTNIGAANTDDLNTALETAKESGEFKGEKGDPGDSGVYIGTTPPEGTKVWINPEGEPSGNYIPTPETAEIGQTIVVKSVDENGKPLEWEAADFPEGEVSWKDIPDKPFDNDIYEWREAIRGTATQEQIKDELVFATTLQSNFIPNIGTTYKVVVFDANKTIEFIGVARDNGVDNLTQKEYYIGLEADGNYTKQSFMNLTYMTIFTATSIGTAYNVNVVIYEQVKVIDPLPAEYLPEIPVDKLPQIPIEKLPEDIGGEVSWNDIKDKPFGDSTTEWVQVAHGTKSGAATNITNFSASLQSGFLPKAGVTYKVVVKDMMTAISREFTGVGNILNGVVYYIGTTADGNYTFSALATYTTLNVYLKEPISTMMALAVTVYERVGTIKPVPADWLPEIPAEKLPEIPVEKLPQIPAEKLPENLNGEITWEEIIDKPTNFVKDYQLEAKGYQTAEQVNALINEALGVIENGTY